MQVTEHLQADRLVQAAHADRFIAGHADQVCDLLARGVIVGGVEQHRTLGLPPGHREQGVSRQRAERLDQPRSGRQARQELAQDSCSPMIFWKPPLSSGPTGLRGVDDHLAGQPVAVLVDELP